ncbi:MAG TPA: hotdog fold thioesterase [Flavobacteriaceae bacterium]|nr:hotdog fold thioesterase [Flavobacteriaceae bacterium]
MEKSETEVLEILNNLRKDTLLNTLDIEFIAVGEDFVEARMPVTSKVHQPDGVLHGGATVALAETVGSVASAVFLDSKNFFVRGIEINANHVRSVRDGYVIARAEFIHKGRTTQVWDIKIRNEEGKLISACKLTTIALPKK